MISKTKNGIVKLIFSGYFPINSFLKRLVLSSFLFLFLHLNIGLITVSAQDSVSFGQDKVRLNFRDVEIMAVLEFYSQLLQKTFIPAEEINGRVTVISPHGISLAEAKKLFFSILDMNQLAVVEYDTWFKVVSKKNAAKSALQLAGLNYNDDRMMTGIIHVEYTKAEDIAEDLARLISDEGAIFAARELNYLVVTSTAANFRKIEQIVKEIDKPESIPIPKAYKIQYMKAEEFANTLTRVSESSSTIERSWGGVVPVNETNSLVITATENQHQTIADLISQLDIFKKQVSISAMFVEVSLNDNIKMGIEWILHGNSNGVETNTANDLGSLFVGEVDNAVQKISGSGLKLSILNPDQFEVLAHFLSDNEDSRVISTPHILTMENQEAKLRVGNEIPVKKGTRYDSENREISTFEQLKLGLELVVTPLISEDQQVTMAIQQKLSNLITYDESNGTYKSSEREANTTVAVKNKETLVIGGLISHEDQQINKGIPGLKDIPILGYLFGSTEEDNNVRELLIFITPTVIANQEEADELNQIEKSKHPLVVDQTSMEFDL